MDNSFTLKNTKKKKKQKESINVKSGEAFPTYKVMVESFPSVEEPLIKALRHKAWWTLSCTLFIIIMAQSHTIWRSVQKAKDVGVQVIWPIVLHNVSEYINNLYFIKKITFSQLHYFFEILILCFSKTTVASPRRHVLSAWAASSFIPVKKVRKIFSTSLTHQDTSF